MLKNYFLNVFQVSSHLFSNALKAIKSSIITVSQIIINTQVGNISTIPMKINYDKKAHLHPRGNPLLRKQTLS